MKRATFGLGLLAVASLAGTAMAGPAATAPDTVIAPKSSSTQSSPADNVLHVGNPADNVLHVGTPVTLKLMEEVTTKEKQARVGQQINLQVAQPVELAGRVVIPVGTPAVGEITEVRYKGMWGKSGHIAAQLSYLRFANRHIRISGKFDEKGTTGTAMVVTSIVLLPIAGFFVTGTSAHLPLGMPVRAFIDEDLPVTFSGAATPAPLTVP